MPGRGNLEVYADNKKKTLYEYRKGNCVLTRPGMVSILARALPAGTYRRTSLHSFVSGIFKLGFGRYAVGLNAFFVYVPRVPKISVLGQHRIPDHSEAMIKPPLLVRGSSVFPH